MFKSHLKAGALASVLVLSSASASATIVEFDTALGKIQVNLYDESTPETVENFLNYVESEAFDNSFIHRSVPDFIVQGGGFFYDVDESEIGRIETDDPVINEPEWSNRKGTIAMAKMRLNANSATSQWFFNLDDNHENLDVQNGGFTVFGEVISGMSVIEDMAELPRLQVNGQLGLDDVPLRDFEGDVVESEDDVTSDNYVMVYSIRVIDDAENSAADLEPVPNTLIDQVGKDDGGSGGGSIGWLGLLALIGLARRFPKP